MQTKDERIPLSVSQIITKQWDPIGVVAEDRLLTLRWDSPVPSHANRLFHHFQAQGALPIGVGKSWLVSLSTYEINGLRRCTWVQNDLEIL
jgi:hypothetical protein